MLLAALLVGCSTPPPPQSRPRTHLVLITLDTTRADRLGCYGYEAIATPHIDALASRGVRFTQAIAPVPITLPSHASLFTALDPHRHGVRENGTFRLDSGHRTLAEVLRDAGYATGAFVGGFPLDSRFGLDQGFDVYDDDLVADNAHRRRENVRWQGHTRPFAERRGDHVIRRGLRWIDDTRPAPFFAWFHLFDPHAEYAPPEPFATSYAGHLYDGEIAWVDSILGDLFQRLNEWGLAERTLVLLTADHGESLGEHQYHGHGKRLYEPSLRIPLLISLPARIEGGRVVDDLVRTTDVMPTILNLLRLDVPTGLQGTSLTPLLAGRPPAVERTAYIETLFPELRFGEEQLSGIRTAGWKYIRYVKAGALIREEVFDLGSDPGETKNLAETDATRTAELAALARAELLGSTTTAQPMEMDAETREKLKTLGYLE